MARGTLFCITTDKDVDVSFHESTYYDKLDAIGADYVEEKTPAESSSALDIFQASMAALGAKIAPGMPLNLPFVPDVDFSFCFENAQQLHEEYFGPRLARLKDAVAKLTLSDVVRSAPCLDSICGNEYSDAVELYDPANGIDGAFMSMDNFIRQIKSGATYYVLDSVIFMH